MKGEWGYRGQNGPSHWHESYPIAIEGLRQSPIDISTVEAETDVGLGEKKLTWKYLRNGLKDMENTGASWKVNVDGSGSELSGGPLDSAYELWQFHAHWGLDSTRGSEHTVDGKQYAGELHLVHWNCSKYASPNEAAAEGDGLAVLGFFLEVGDDPHPELAKVLDRLPKIRTKGSKVEFSSPDEEEGGAEESDDAVPNPELFFPENAAENYWTYEGSLTTPPLLESVIWIVFKEPIRVSEEQMSKMRQLLTCEEESSDECMTDNFRPPISKGDRKVRVC